MLKTIRTGALALLAVLLLTVSPAAAQQGKALGKFDDWGAQTFPEDGKLGCSMWSKPTKEEGKYDKRGEVFVYVTHRSWSKRINEVSFVMGYPLKKGSEVHVLIGGTKFTLFTDGDAAWNRTAKEDAAMVEAMRRGATMIVEGISSRGTHTKDTYSLTGFTAAHNAINGACKVE